MQDWKTDQHNTRTMTDKPRKTLTLNRKPNKPEGTTPSGDKTVAGKRVIRREPSTVQQPRNKPGKGKAPRKKPAATRKTVTPPSDLRMRELGQQLNSYSGIWRDRLPLAIGIEKAIFRYVSGNHISASKRVVQKLLHQHTSSAQYLRNVMQLAARYHLDGSLAGEIIPAEKEYAGLKVASLPPT